MQVTVVGTNLPGRTFCEYGDVHVGVQCQRDGEQFQPGDAVKATFAFELDPTGDRDARGPYAQGRPGESFVYLTWVAGPEREMFRRAKLMLRDVPADVWAQAVAGGRLEGSVELTDPKGGPLCGTLKPGVVVWRAPAAGRARP